MPGDDTTTVQSLIRGLAVIRSFSATAPRQTLAQVAEHTGLARATARRFLHTLVATGYAATDGSDFWLTPRVLELGYSYMSGLTLPSIAQPRLEQLSRVVDDSSSMSVMDGREIVYVNRVPVRRIMTVSITIGTRFPAHATSMGRVMLAGLSPEQRRDYLSTTELVALTPATIVDRHRLFDELETVSQQGWCIVDQELEPGLRSVAAPVYSPSGDPVAAINISTQTAVHSLDELHSRYLPAILDTAQIISDDYASTRLL
ncbi:IclR family transcriptional regulator domain-containing protein [Corynebacterium doosanense]|uniref:IclR family transcriptional regulator n=1 Tax=Corynebacterium doosanense CAU 212 = DSM 45436 TaxID=558173 RepID=A0A097IHR0_9CORY|nr:IclR family transcriptional regulator C-terminal domain-containing protein [Corynebacterium doosanense]AIT61663.1 IclR family transcriptional regulator [Corynebacterium doosanense CAU 212 = DSM 45436]